MVLDPLCESAAGLLDAGGSMLLVQSALSGVEKSLNSLRSTGLEAEVIAYQVIPFGPVLSARAGWLTATGQIKRGCRTEELVGGDVVESDRFLVAVCTCRRSKDYPMCDTSHRRCQPAAQANSAKLP